MQFIENQKMKYIFSAFRRMEKIAGREIQAGIADRFYSMDNKNDL